jgi:hypothetical protein
MLWHFGPRLLHQHSTPILNCHGVQPLYPSTTFIAKMQCLALKHSTTHSIITLIYQIDISAQCKRARNKSAPAMTVRPTTSTSIMEERAKTTLKEKDHFIFKCLSLERCLFRPLFSTLTVAQLSQQLQLLNFDAKCHTFWTSFVANWGAFFTKWSVLQ